MLETPETEKVVTITQIRTVSDLERILPPLLYVSQMAFPDERSDKQITKFFKNNITNGFLFVATIEDTYVGICQALQMSFIQQVKSPLTILIDLGISAIDDWALTGIAVLPEYQNQGIGKKLTQICIEAMFEKMGDRSDANIFVEIGFQRKVSFILHRKLGFEEVHRDDKYVYLKLERTLLSTV